MILVILSVTLIMFSCKNYKISKNDILNTKISVPLDSMLFVNEKLISMEKTSNTRYRFISYLDSISCTRCQLYKMGMWSRLENITKKANVQYIFILSPPKENIQSIKDEYINTKQNHLLYLDTLGLLERNNPIIKKSVLFHSFLLDENNKVVFVCKTSKNEKVRKEYLEYVHSIERKINKE